MSALAAQGGGRARYVVDLRLPGHSSLAHLDDLREMSMLGDAGSNALGALLGWNSVDRLTVRGRWIAVGALAGLTALGERTSLGRLIERTPVLRSVDKWGVRQ